MKQPRTIECVRTDVLANDPNGITCYSPGLQSWGVDMNSPLVPKGLPKPIQKVVPSGPGFRNSIPPRTEVQGYNRSSLRDKTSCCSYYLADIFNLLTTYFSILAPGSLLLASILTGILSRQRTPYDLHRTFTISTSHPSRMSLPGLTAWLDCCPEETQCRFT